MSIQTQRKTQEKHQCPKKEPVLDAMEDFGYLTQQLPKRKTHKKPGASKVTHNLQLFILCNLHTKELKQSKIHQKRNGPVLTTGHALTVSSMSEMTPMPCGRTKAATSEFSAEQPITRLSYSCIMVT